VFPPENRITFFWITPWDKCSSKFPRVWWRISGGGELHIFWALSCSGATEAWLVDGLKFSKYGGALESVFAKGSIVGGAAMLSGSVAGGISPQSPTLVCPI
jgi:hypothetical protein